MPPRPKASAPPACKSVGGYCQELRVTLRVASCQDGLASADTEATWLLGHTQRLSFGPLRRRRGSLEADAILAIPCRHAETRPGRVHCRAHGFDGPPPTVKHRAEPRRLGNETFQYVDRGQMVAGPLRAPVPPRSLPVVSANPCATARCRTADQTIGAACCRDLQLEILCSPRATWLESLIRHRKAPYLCKVERESRDSLGVEVISACAYLMDDAVSCDLHGRVRPNGTQAKPDLCFEWPNGSEVFHTACVFTPEMQAANRLINKDLPFSS
jgi:hypothetical protein